MKIYLAGIFAATFHFQSPLFYRLTEREQAARKGVKYYLESYHYVYRQSYVERMKADGVKIFLDSGAFSAFTQGAEIDLPGYCDYIKRNMEVIEKVDRDICASVLDGIGDPQKTYENQLAMEAHGVRPLPCFHYGEDERYLEWYIANYDYITLGGMVPISTPQLFLWLDRIWDKYLCDGAGRPKIKVHGFGLTSFDLMERYPWFSVDSSSWVRTAATGGILMPVKKGMQMISISTASPQRRVEGQHADTIPGPQKEALRRILDEQGFDLERLQNVYLGRWAYNCWSFTDIMERLSRGEAKFEGDQISLF
jgi:hypothetical protein